MKKYISSVALASLTLASPALLTASAEDVEFVSSESVNITLARQNIDVAVKSSLADSVQALFVDDYPDRTYSSEFDEGVITAVRASYAQHLFDPIWTKEGAKSLADSYDRLGANGIENSGIEASDIAALVKARFSGDNSTKALADVQMTMTWLKMASLVSGGLADEGSAVNSTKDAPAQSALVSNLVLAGEGQADTLLESYQPDHPQYSGLQNVLEHYRDLAGTGGWSAISDGRAPEAGDTDPRIPALRQRLIAEGYYKLPGIVELFNMIAARVPSEEIPAEEHKSAALEAFETWFVTYDESLEAAVKSFQSHHGLTQDGVLGAKTLLALNESVASKIHRIETTMATWRTQTGMDDRYVWANIPSYTVEGWDDGHREITMKSVVGMPSRATPIFSDEIEYAVTNPKWYAPISIVRRDKLPKLANDPSYAASHGFSIYDRESGEKVAADSVNWSDASSATRYSLVQSAGSSNALGELKIIFPNEHSVYLHGTPTKYLFDRDERAFSSGCVRLEHPVELAEWLAGKDNDVSVEKLDAALARGSNQRFYFAEHTPVHLTYMTVTVGDDGQPQFWRDIYNRESNITETEMVAELYQPATPSEVKATPTDSFAHLETDQPQFAG